MKIVLALLFLTLGAHAGESGPDNGTDYVKVLFAEAQANVNQELAAISNFDQLSLDTEFHNWLQGNSNSGQPRFSLLKTYLQIIELQFQLAPCKDSHGLESTICFQYQSGKPVVLISVTHNRLTTSDQAMAMLIHEAGHFVGEMDHLFLDRLGIALVKALKQPAFIETSVQSTEIAANIFSAKSECENGTSQQAKTLAKRAHQQIAQSCSERQISCDLTNIESAFTGTIEYIQGQGFTMKVTCQLKSLLRLQSQ